MLSAKMAVSIGYSSSVAVVGGSASAPSGELPPGIKVSSSGSDACSGCDINFVMAAHKEVDEITENLLRSLDGLVSSMSVSDKPEGQESLAN